MTTPTAHRGDIQGMRAVAVLLVMLNHAGIPGLTGGYIGVDVFFVISGYLITGILVREVRRTGRISIADFYARRARRILPAASVALLVIVLAATKAYTYVRIDQVLAHVTWAACFAANIHSALSGADYFAADSFVSPVQHFWSLAVEEQFYLVWPPVIALVLWTGGRHRGDGPPDPVQTSKRLRRLAVAISLLCAASLAWSVWRTGAEPAMAYFSTLTRGWELGTGALLALCTSRVARLPKQLKLGASWLGLAAIGYAAVTYSATTPFPGYHAAVPVFGAALVLLGGTDGPRYGAALLLDRAPMRWIGDISYSLYLWHWPLLVMPPAYLERDLRLRERVALMAVAIVVAWLSYRFVETPVRRAKTLSRSRLKALVLWPVAAAVVVAAVFGVQTRFGREAMADVPYVEPTVDPEPGTVQNSSDPAVNAAGFAAELARADYPLPRGLKPFPGDLISDNWRLPGVCWAQTTALRHEICPMGDTNGTHTIVLFGDSHMAMWIEPMLQAAQEHGWKLVPFIKTGCFPANVTMWRPERKGPYTECDTYRQWAYGEIAKIKPDRIITTGWITQPIMDPVTRKRIAVKDSGPVFTAGVESSMRTLRDLAPQVYVIGAVTNLPKEPKDCLGSRKATMGTCAQAVDKLTSDRNRAWKRVADKTGAHWVDVLPWFCDHGTCPIVVRNLVVYTDTHHITKTYARTLAPGLARKLDL